MARKKQTTMTCWQCPRYDRDQRHCLDGKTNPSKKSDAVVVAELLGLRALCHYNAFRDSLALRMYFPKAPETVTSSARKLRAKPADITIEILDEETSE